MQFRILSSSIVRAVRQPSYQAVRTFVAPSTPLAKDIVQDLFVKELRGYKPSATSKSADLDQVKTFRAPAQPTAPVVDENIETAVADYARADVVATAQSTGAEEAIPVEYLFPKESEVVEEAH
ncbi:hypothetical protein BDF19DRAFT_454213 [Syncephalis fuscata]|nr:hypothetical protein BDF19DRAFT_454213 [Syncephalis fuscata]